MMKENPDWGHMESMAHAALVPSGRSVPLSECPSGPFMFDNCIGWMSQYGNEGYNEAGEILHLNDVEMVQPLAIVTQALDTKTHTLDYFGGVKFTDVVLERVEVSEEPAVSYRGAIAERANTLVSEWYGDFSETTQGREPMPPRLSPSSPIEDLCEWREWNGPSSHLDDIDRQWELLARDLPDGCLTGDDE